LNARLNQAADQRNSILSSNEELHDRVNALQVKLEELKTQSVMVSEENATVQALLLEKEREK